MVIRMLSSKWKSLWLKASGDQDQVINLFMERE